MAISDASAAILLPDSVAARLALYRRRGARILLLGSERAGALRLGRALFGAEVEVDIAAPDQGELAAAAFDVVVDARPAPAGDRIAAFRTLWPLLAAGGSYLCVGTGAQGAGDQRALRGFFTGLLDDLHAFHKRGRRAEEFRASEYTRTVDSAHFYPDCILIERRDRRPPEMVYTGEPQF